PMYRLMRRVRHLRLAAVQEIDVGRPLRRISDDRGTGPDVIDELAILLDQQHRTHRAATNLRRLADEDGEVLVRFVVRDFRTTLAAGVLNLDFAARTEVNERASDHGRAHHPRNGDAIRCGLLLTVADVRAVDLGRVN